MAKSELGGVWRTINGNRVFIKEGQSVAEAIEEDKKKKGKTETKETENKPKEIENKSDDDKRFAELKEKFDKGEIEKYSDEDYELRDRNLDKKVKEGILTKEEAEEQKLRNDFQTDRISRDEYEKRKGNFGEEMASDTPEKREERKKWREEQERPTSDVDKETAKANRQTEKIEKGKDDFDPVDFEKWRVENDPEFEMSDDTARYIYEIDKETGSRGGSKKETAEGRLEQLKKEGKVDSTGTKAVDRETQKEVNKLYLDTHEPIDTDVWEKQEDGSFKANKDAMKADYEARHKKYDDKIKQFAEDRENMTNSDWEASIMAYEKQNADGTYKTMQDIMDDVDAYEKSKNDTIYKDGKKYNVVEHREESQYEGIGANRRKFVGTTPERYRIENPDDKSDWGWINKKQYDNLKQSYDEKGEPRYLHDGKKDIEEEFRQIYAEEGLEYGLRDSNVEYLSKKYDIPKTQVKAFMNDTAKKYDEDLAKINNANKSTNDIMNDKIISGANKVYKVDTTKMKGETGTLPTRTPEEQESDMKYANARVLYNLTGDEKYKKEYKNELEKTYDKMQEKASKSNSNSISNNLSRAAYNKYLKEHPGSKISFEDFKKKKNK